MRWRVLAAVVAGCLAGCFTALMLKTGVAGAVGGDLSWPLVGARELLRGQNPYRSVDLYAWLNPLPQYWPLYYPLPALIIVAPVSWLPLPAAAIVFAGLSIAALTWAFLDRWRYLLPLLVSFPMAAALVYVQWSPLLVASAALGWWPLLLCKPTLGLPLLMWRRPTSRKGWISIGVAGGVAALSIPLGWLDNSQQHEHLIPLVAPWGWVLLVALVRWKDPRVWLLLMLALVPQRGGMDQLAIGLVARSAREAAIWSIGSWITTFTALAAGYGPSGVVLALYYLALGIVLTSRVAPQGDGAAHDAQRIAVTA